MEHLFYLFILFPIAWEMVIISAPIRVGTFLKSFRNRNGENATPKQKTLANYMLGYMVWCILGLITTNWVLFLILLILGLFPKSKTFLLFINGVLSFSVLILIGLNKYQLHIDIFSLLKSYFY